MKYTGNMSDKYNHMICNVHTRHSPCQNSLGIHLLVFHYLYIRSISCKKECYSELSYIITTMANDFSWISCRMKYLHLWSMLRKQMRQKELWMFVQTSSHFPCFHCRDLQYHLWETSVICEDQ